MAGRVDSKIRPSMITPELQSSPGSHKQSPDRRARGSHPPTPTRNEDASPEPRSDKATLKFKQHMVKGQVVYSPPSSLAVSKSRAQTPQRSISASATSRTNASGRPPTVTVNILRIASSPQAKTNPRDIKTQDLSPEPSEYEETAQNYQGPPKSYFNYVSDQNMPPPDSAAVEDLSSKGYTTDIPSSPPRKVRFENEDKLSESDSSPSSIAHEPIMIHEDYDVEDEHDKHDNHEDDDDEDEIDEYDIDIDEENIEERDLGECDVCQSDSTSSDDSDSDEDEDDEFWNHSPLLDPRTGKLDLNRSYLPTILEDRDNESRYDDSKPKPLLGSETGKLDRDHGSFSTINDEEDNDEDDQVDEDGDEDDDSLKQSPPLNPRTGKLDQSWDPRYLEWNWDDFLMSDLQTTASDHSSEPAHSLLENNDLTDHRPDETQQVTKRLSLEILEDRPLEDTSSSDVTDQIAQINSPPRFIHCFKDVSPGNIYTTLNFNFHSFYEPIVEVADVFLPRTIQFDKIALDNKDVWFSAPTASRPYMMCQTWRNCSHYDAHLIRDLHCAYNITLHKLLEKLKIYITPGSWTDVWVDPCQFVVDLCSNLECSDEDLEHIWSDYGIDVFKFVETQSILRSTPYSFKPDAIEIYALHEPTNRAPGRNMYLLTCLLLPNGTFNTRQFPPQILTTSSLSETTDGLKCAIMPDIWHPHLAVSKAETAPSYTVTGDNPWLEWDPKQNCFKGDIPLADVISISDGGRISVTITGEYNLNIGTSKIGLHESITTRLYLPLPSKQEVASDDTDIEIDDYTYPMTAVSLLCSSLWLGFDQKHSDCVVNMSRAYERAIRDYNFASEMARKQPAAFDVHQWENQSGAKKPWMKSLGPTPWYTFLTERQQEEYYRLHDREGRQKFIQSLQHDRRQEPLTWTLDEKERAEVGVDEDLEQMRRMYETQFNEAHVILWLNTTYRESMQDRLLEESHDDCEVYTGTSL
ncbi:hypothetical protein TWF696_007165 [Orbilia brochopaga]|uniref:Uncharacterized protein n=1 Tax=Orbilia brochopaga TaxID=3140254 RepID=A0AAV9UTL7_9PEZI